MCIATFTHTYRSNRRCVLSCRLMIIGSWQIFNYAVLHVNICSSKLRMCLPFVKVWILWFYTECLCVVLSLCSEPGCHRHHLLGVLRPLHCHPLSSPWMDLWQLHVQICCLSSAGKHTTYLFQSYHNHNDIFLGSECVIHLRLLQRELKKRHWSNTLDLLIN